MPVISLPEYLGISEAPQQPVFQRTRQVEPDSPWARTMQVADSLTALRNQRPMAQIQAIQNEYDMIRENAEKLRREREAAMQAEQAVGALFDVDGQKPDYLERKQAVLKQFPMAQFDPRVQNYIENNDRMFDAQQKAEARRQEEITTRAADLVRKGGIDIAKAQEAAKSPLTAAQLEYQFGKPTSSNIGRLEKALGTVQDLIKSVPEEERYDFVDGKQIVRPEFKTLLDRQKKYADMYFNEVEGISPQQEAPTATPAAPATPSVAPAATVTPPAPKVDFDAATKARLAEVPADELAGAIEKEKAKAKEVDEINQVWQKAKESIEGKLKNVLPDKDIGFGINPLEQFALQVLSGKTVIDPNIQIKGGGAPVPGGFIPAAVPVQRKVLEKLGLSPGDAVFTEPGEKRKSFFGLIGTQDVTYDELVKDWAEKFAAQRGLTDGAPSAKQIAPEARQKALSKVMEKVEQGAPVK
jgi:hypothetical protein